MTSVTDRLRAKLVLVAAASTISVLGVSSASANTKGPVENALAKRYGKLPIVFEPNRGQFNSKYDFIARGSGGLLMFRASEWLVVLPAKSKAEPSSIRMSLVSAASVEPQPSKRTAGISSYLVGRDAAHWVTNVPH